MRVASWIVVLMGVLVGTQASAQTPTFKPGQFVYTIPEGFDPPGIGRTGVDMLQNTLAGLHNPFVVVFVKALPGGDADKAVRDVGGSVLTAWEASGVSLGKMSVFFQAFSPRKFYLRVGKEWEANLGLTTTAHKPYTDKFVAKAKGNNFTGGILDMAKALDGYIFENTDPATLAAKAEAARVAHEAQVAHEKAAAEAKMLALAQGAISEQITRLEKALAYRDGHPEWLPADAADYDKVYSRAREVRDRNNPAEMASTAAEIKPTIDNLVSFVDEKVSAHRARVFWFVVCWAGILLAAAGLVVAVWLQRRMCRKMRQQFDAAIAGWKERIQNAAGNYVKFYGSRESVLPLGTMTGKTKALYDSVTTGIDAIYTAVRAMEDRIDKVAAVAAKASWINPAPLKAALAMLDEEFEFDTGTLTDSDLFSRGTKVVQVRPSTFADDLQHRFKVNMTGWAQLKTAGDAWATLAEEHFRQADLDALLVKAAENGIPNRWLSDHPLFGDDEADKAFWTGINTLRATDPLAYAEKVAQVKAKIADIGQMLDALVAAQKSVKDAAKMGAAVQVHTGITLDPTDDPKVTLDAARNEEAKVAGLLASADDAADVIKQAAKVCDLYKKVTQQAATAAQADKAARDSLDAAGVASGQASAKVAEAGKRAEAAKQVHRNVKADGLIEAARKYAQNAQRDLDKARKQMDDHRPLNARRTADKATEQFEEATKQAKAAVAHCDDLDKQKADYEREVAQMEAKRKQYEKKIRQYGRSASLPEYRPTVVVQQAGGMGPLDYALMYGSLNSAESAWEHEARSAQRAYEAEVQARHEAERAAEQARQEADAARQREESYSRSSWSDSDSGSSGSYDSGSSGCDTGSSGDY